MPETRTLPSPAPAPASPAPGATPARRSGGLARWIPRNLSALQLVSLVLALAMAVLILFPLLMAVLTVLGVSGGSGFSDVWAAVADPRTLQAFGNTLLLVLLGGGIAVLVGALLAWLNERTDARIGWLAELLPLVSMFVPSLAASIGWVFLLDPDVGLLNMILRQIAGVFGADLATGPFSIYSWYGLTWAYAVFLVPFAYLAISNGLRSLDPALEEASIMSGASPLKTLIRVTLPSLKPALAGAALIVVVMGMALYSIPVVIGTPAHINTLPVMIVQDVTQTYPVNQAGAYGRSFLLLAVVIVALMAQRRFLGKQTAYATIGGKGGRATLTSLGPWKIVARLVMIGYILSAAVLPFLGLVFVSLQRFWSANVDFSTLSVQSYVDMFSRGILREGLTNSIVLAAVCATIVVAVALLLAYWIESHKGRGVLAVDGVLKIPAALPNIVFALALISAFGGPPFGWSGTALILVAAYVLMYYPQASVYASAAMQQIGSVLVEASTVSGASPGRTLRRILLPLMLPSLLAAWALTFVLMMGDITASAMLGSTRTPVVGFVMLDQWANGSYPTIAALGVTLTTLSTVVVLGVVLLRQRLRIQ